MSWICYIFYFCPEVYQQKRRKTEKKNYIDPIFWVQIVLMVSGLLLSFDKNTTTVFLWLLCCLLNYIWLTKHALSLTEDTSWMLQLQNSLHTDIWHLPQYYHTACLHPTLSSFPLLQGGESIPVYSRLPCSVPADVRATLPRAMADTRLEGCLREGHNSLWAEERHSLWD